MTLLVEDDIRDAVVDKLMELGVEVSTYLLGYLDRLLLTLDLTDEQVTELTALVEGLEDSDATKTAIRDAITGYLGGLGIEVQTSLCGDHAGKTVAHFHYFYPDLTDDQRVEIITVVVEMQVANATHTEIKDAIKILLVEWGVIEEEAEEVPAAPSAHSTDQINITSWGSVKSAR